MAGDRKGAEKRRFGRREMRVQGVAHVPGRPPAYCIVRDLSQGGAFLEFQEPVVPSINFRLVIETHGIDAICEVRHHRSRGVGVMFDKVQGLHKLEPKRIADSQLRELVLWQMDHAKAD
ncbi:MAG: hypothetical protein RLZ98_980 [Pseudomonadota bacterium]|jgi:hypothetical protein